MLECLLVVNGIIIVRVDRQTQFCAILWRKLLNGCEKKNRFLHLTTGKPTLCHPALNGYQFTIGKDKATKKEGWPFSSAVLSC